MKINVESEMIHAYDRKKAANVNFEKMNSLIQRLNLYTSGGQNESAEKGLILCFLYTFLSIFLNSNM